VSRAQFLAIVLAGLALRAAALPGPGTGDVTVFKVWSYNAATSGVAEMYGVGGDPLEWRRLEWLGVDAYVVYPPLVLYELGVTGRAFRLWSHHRFPNTTALNVFIKLPALVSEIGLAWLLFWLARRQLGVDAARWAATAYWLNPAALINASVLGYLDPQFALPAVGAVAAGASGWPALAGALVGVAVLTKPQGIFIIPAVALALWMMGRPDRRVARFAAATAGGGAVTAAVVAPIVRAGGSANMVAALGELAHHDMVSANACNLWWVVDYVLRVRFSVHDVGVWAALTAQNRILGISRMIEIGFPNPQPIGLALTAIAVVWALWAAARRRSMDLWLLAALAAFTVHAYTTLSVQVHENHLFGAVPLLVVAAAGRRAFRPVLVVVSAITALNLNVFYGFGDGVGYAIPRDVTLIDLSVVLAVANCAALAWHARIFSRECSTGGAPLQTSGPASIPAPAGHSHSSGN